MDESTVIDHTCSADECSHKDTYRMEVSCSNCDWKGEIRVTCGHEPSVGWAGSAECPRCETSRLHKGAFVARESALSTSPSGGEARDA